MTDKEYIRRAVELADGWHVTYHANGNVDAILSGDSLWATDWRQSQLDALAAQLVRQVDALGGPYFDSRCRDVYVWLPGQEIAHVNGPDRTMNTIKAIVDSGVLEKDDE